MEGAVDTVDNTAQHNAQHNGCKNLAYKVSAIGYTARTLQKEIPRRVDK